jgi:hypothetical protein
MDDLLSYSSYMKSPYRSIKHTTYFTAYDDLFCRYKGREITFVEIGVLGGGSLFMWRDFFGDKARIIGVDFNPNAKKWESAGFEIFIGSQSDEKFWSKFINTVGPIDIVLDDGGHTYKQQIITAEKLLGNIKDGGMLVVEDTHTSYLNGFGYKKYSFIEYVKKFADKINQRFGYLDGNSDARVWSIQIYESIVAFHINKNFSNLKSEPTDNGAIDDSAQDFRYADNSVMSAYYKAIKKFNFLKHIPGARWIRDKVLVSLSAIKGSEGTKKYF